MPDPSPIAVVHVVAKAHLDLGFTGLAAEVEADYVERWFPRAIATAADLRSAGGAERLVWTTGSWILQRALVAADERGDPSVADAVARGDLAWHALPVTTHTELADAALLRAGLAVGADLARRFRRPPVVAAKLTDVPGHTRGLVPLLAEAGVGFLHVGVNPAWPVPAVPRAFRWRSPDGAEVVVAYAVGGYGADVVVPGCGEALAFLHAGDNGGPPSPEDVVAGHAAIARRFPGAEVRASTLDDFAVALLASGAAAELPVVTAEIGDPWLFGAGSDPLKVAAYRELLRRRSGDEPAARPLAAADRQVVDERLLLVAEHTWGLDVKSSLPDDAHWHHAALERLRATPAARRMEASWAEQRAYVDDAAHALADATATAATATVDALARDARAWVALLAADAPGADVGEDPTVAVDGWTLSLDPATGGLRALVTPEGRRLAGDDHRLGVLSYQAFDEDDYDRFYRQLTPTADDEWWAQWDNTKPGLRGHGARSQRWTAEVVRAWQPARPEGAPPQLAVELRFPTEARALGAPRAAWACWTCVPSARRVELRVAWADKPAERRPEALWCSFRPLVAEPERWTMDKLGQAVSPLDVVRHGGRALHAVGEGVAHDGPEGALRLRTPDAPLVAPGEPRLLDADPPVPDLAGGWHVLLADNLWGTNFPQWIEGPASFRFAIGVDAPR